MKVDPIVRYLDKTQIIPCPYGNVKRVVTGGEGLANVHVVCVTKGSEHFHHSYNELYYFLTGTGTLRLNGTEHDIRPGAVAVIPAGVNHSLTSDSDKPIEFIIFGTPPMSIDDKRAKPMKTQSDKGTKGDKNEDN